MCLIPDYNDLLMHMLCLALVGSTYKLGRKGVVVEFLSNSQSQKVGRFCQLQMNYIRILSSNSMICFNLMLSG